MAEVIDHHIFFTIMHMCTTSHFYQYQFHRSHIGFTLFIKEDKYISIVLQIQNNIFKVFLIFKKKYILYYILIHVYIKCSNKNKNSNIWQQQKEITSALSRCAIHMYLGRFQNHLPVSHPSIQFVLVFLLCKEIFYMWIAHNFSLHAELL